MTSEFFQPLLSHLIRREKADPDFSLGIKEVVPSFMDTAHLGQPSYLILPS